jgi:prophage regulatory protein
MNYHRTQGSAKLTPPVDGRTTATMAFLNEIHGKRRPAVRPAVPAPAQEPQTLPTCAADVCLIRIKEVLAICGKSRSSVYELIQKGAFPPPVKLGGRSSAWIKAEVLAWVEHCIRTSRGR